MTTLIDVRNRLMDAYDNNQKIDGAESGELANAIDTYLSQHSGGGEVVAWRYRSPAQIEFNRPWSVTEDAELVRLMTEAGGHQIEPLYTIVHPRPVVPEAQPKLIGWRMADYTAETSDPEKAKNWSSNVTVLPIFEGDPNTKLSAAPIPTTNAGRG